MKKKNIFLEKIHKNIGQFVYIKSIIFEKKTKYQNLLLLNNKKLGKVFILDNVIQKTDFDEFIYNEIISFVPIFSHENPQNILIIGGGDGGCLNNILKIKNLKSIFIVEIDKDVIECSKKYFFEKTKNPFKNKKVKIIIDNGFNFLKKNKKLFDIIIVDGTDPIGPGKCLFSTEFYKLCKKSLNKNGIFTSQNGVFLLQKKETFSSFYKLKKIFKYCGFFHANIPTYYGGIMLFSWGSNNKNIKNIKINLLKEKIKKIKLIFKYYNPYIHIGSFYLPQFLLKELNLFKN